MKGRSLAAIKETKTASLEELKITIKNAYEKWFEDWKKRQRIEREYFEGDKIDSEKYSPTKKESHPFLPNLES